MEREQLVPAIAGRMASNWWSTSEGRAHIAVVLDSLSELGCSVHGPEDRADMAVGRRVRECADLLARGETNLDSAITEMGRAVSALWLELPPAVAKDVARRWQDLLDALVVARGEANSGT